MGAGLLQTYRTIDVAVTGLTTGATKLRHAPYQQLEHPPTNMINKCFQQLHANVNLMLLL